MALPKFLNNLTLFATRPATLQRCEFAGYAFWNISKMRSICIPLEKGEMAIYIETYDMEKAHVLEANKVMTRDSWNEHLIFYKNGKSDFKKIENEIKNITNDQNNLLKIYKKWLELLNRWGVIAFFPFAIEFIIDPKFRMLVKKEVPLEFDNIINAISSPSQLNAYQEMQIDILSAAETNNYDVAKKLADKWGWYSEYSYIELPLKEEYFIAEIKKIDSTLAKKEKDKIFEEVKKNKERYISVLSSIKDDKIKLYAEILHTYTFLRTDRIDIFKKGQTAMRKVYDLIANLLSKKTGEKWERIHVVNLLNSEILNFLEKSIIPEKKNVDLRIGGNYLYIFDKGVPEIIIDSKLISEAHNIINKNIKQEIRGLVAYKGKVTGKVALVKNKSDLLKVKEGDILVSRTTMPDYTPAMKISSAFVTEEGGITSHAAIIARELKKPCIVGTGNCTKILKDGDLIEVDADNGVVKVIK